MQFSDFLLTSLHIEAFNRSCFSCVLSVFVRVVPVSGKLSNVRYPTNRYPVWPDILL